MTKREFAKFCEDNIELGGESPRGTVQAIISNDATHATGTFVIGTWKTAATT